MPIHLTIAASKRWRTLLAIAFLLPATAWAQMAFTTQPVNLRAGPDRSFPMVAWIPAGTQVNVIGCINGWTWCDVNFGFNRGLVSAHFLSQNVRPPSGGTPPSGGRPPDSGRPPSGGNPGGRPL